MFGFMMDSGAKDKDMQLFEPFFDNLDVLRQSRTTDYWIYSPILLVQE